MTAYLTQFGSDSYMQIRLKLIFLIALILPVSGMESGLRAEDNGRQSRQTPIVRAVAGCRLSVVNLRGRKTVPVDDNDRTGAKVKQVNGMGTGVVIDPRGYVLTNYHVVEGVRTIEVTTSDRQRTTAKLLAHDPATDLAVLKIDLQRPLPKIRVGTSSDLMLAEQVIAVGNAYGYEHTVTVGIISSLSRTVQVNDDQIYHNLIQTDAAINPGNSGGPLLNTHGEMIGINVAVRVGAQGIAFAIPVNDAIEVAADLLSEIAPQDVYHGLTVRTHYIQDRPHLQVTAIDKAGPAAKTGIKPGDILSTVNGTSVASRMDFQTVLLNSQDRKQLELQVKGQAGREHQLVLEKKQVTPRVDASASALAWNPLGLKLVPASEAELKGRHPNYKKGLRVMAVRKQSPAEAEGIMPGDVLVAMHGWKTESLENLAYILQRPDILGRKNFMFYILRDQEPFWGQMRVANLPR